MKTNQKVGLGFWGFSLLNFLLVWSDALTGFTCYPTHAPSLFLGICAIVSGYIGCATYFGDPA